MRPLFSRAARNDPAEEDRFRDTVASAFAQVYARNESIEVHPKASVVISSPSGARWKITVADDGTLSAVAV